ncbi:ECF RNA polymerase sigma factor SigE [Dyadobacter sp. CECT 9275]|uniref:ECF RNA polymerase sigma factor SigE n=1 Tax=Dyadobacter helix TaxID=2822344 RepID=A0A916JJL7_9BACT|nr:RNA polymerase sigma-70 factor [Dyadobacter sp. CECT 9275]CAG5017073.1 ECF RNA polymerase sigma factor SigE [Dyadobacter sp. CECT 9275]
MTAFPLYDPDEIPQGRSSDTPAESNAGTRVTDDEWLLRAQFESDPDKGCELLFRRYYVNLCNHAIRFVHSREVAEDIVSEIFAVFWQKQLYKQVNTSYRAYLYKSVRHRSYNYLKWQVKYIHTEEGDDQPADVLNPDEALQFTELHQKIENIIGNLPPQCRKAYLLKRVEGKKYEEIAAELRISSKAVEALVSRALARLRKELAVYWILSLLLLLN